MKAYFYDENTLEYKYSDEITQDPLESAVQGKIVYAIPAHSTLTKVPKHDSHYQTAVYNKNTDKWNIVEDYRRNFKAVDMFKNTFYIYNIGPLEEGLIPVELEVAQEIETYPDKFYISNNELLMYTDEEWEQIETGKREVSFKRTFIETPWGWYRKIPQGYSNAPQSIDIILNMVNISGGLTEQVTDLMIFYEKPDFTKPEQCEETWLVEHQKHPEVCSTADFMQFYVAFQTAWALDQYKS